MRSEKQNGEIMAGDRIRTGVYVCGKWVPMWLGTVNSVSTDGTTAQINAGGRVYFTDMRNIRKEMDDVCGCPAKSMPFGKCCKVE